MARDSDIDGNEPNEPPAQRGGSEDRISNAIKQAYDTVANEPLPDKLNALLEQLRQGGEK